MRFSIDRRWATLVVAVVLGAAGGGLLGFVTAPVPDGDAQGLAPGQQLAPSTTRRPRSRLAGVSSTTATRPRPRVLPAATAGLSPATSSTTTTTSTVRPTTTTAAPTTSTTVEPTTTTIGGDTTTTSSTMSSSTTSTT